MSQIEKNLMPGEKLLVDSGLSWIIFFWPLMASALLIYFMFKQHVLFMINYVAIGLIIYFLGSSFLRYITTHFMLTSARVRKKTGWFVTQVFEISLNRIESVRFEQSLFGKLFGFGSVIVNGTGGDQIVLMMIDNPSLFQQQIFQAMELTKANS